MGTVTTKVIGWVWPEFECWIIKEWQGWVGGMHYLNISVGFFRYVHKKPGSKIYSKCPHFLCRHQIRLLGGVMRGEGQLMYPTLGKSLKQTHKRLIITMYKFPLKEKRINSRISEFILIKTFLSFSGIFLIKAFEFIQIA